MTIFNWVQKKLHQNVIKEIDVVTKDEKKKKQNEGKSEIEKNTKAILDQVGLVDAFDNWFDGVLTIGTFGFDTLNFKEEYEKDVDDDECGSMDLDYVVVDGKNVDDQELDPLISNENKFSDDHHEDVVVLDTDHNDHFGSSETAEMPVIAMAVEAEIEPKKKRPTLAELFKEDRDRDEDTWNGKKSKNPNLDGDEEVKYDKQKGSKLSKKFSLVKKKLVMSKSKDEEKDLRPIKKMHQMIKRMLKKKIHPDIYATSKGLKKDVQNKPNHKCEPLESCYLLNIQDCIA